MRTIVRVIAIGLATVGCEPQPPSGARTQAAASTANAHPLVGASASTAVAVPGSRATTAVDAGKAPGKPVAVLAATGKVRELTWSFDDSPVGDMRVVVVVPREAGPKRKLPVLITMHGQGEAIKGPAKGARGWVDDYWLPKALRRLSSPPLTGADFRNRFSDTRLDLFNRTLETRPYQGLIVVCPYTPHKILKGKAAFTQASRLADFLVDDVIPRVYAETPAIGTAETTAVDGVSLGGRAAVLVGLARPEAFGALGALQPAFDVEDAPQLAARARKALEKNPRMAIRLLTSEGDYYLASTRAISQAMKDSGVRHTLDVVPGDHSYDFNRGPGVYEMLLFHDRALRGVPHLNGEGT